MYWPTFAFLGVAPVRERGLKCNTVQAYAYINRRSREGAWIEILAVLVSILSTLVAPVRERGLKFIFVLPKRQCQHVAPVRERGLKLLSVVLCLTVLSRSREGAWIEMLRARSETSFA